MTLSIVGGSHTAPPGSADNSQQVVSKQSLPNDLILYVFGFLSRKGRAQVSLLNKRLQVMSRQFLPNGLVFYVIGFLPLKEQAPVRRINRQVQLLSTKLWENINLTAMFSKSRVHNGALYHIYVDVELKGAPPHNKLAIACNIYPRLENCVKELGASGGKGQLRIWTNPILRFQAVVKLMAEIG